MAASSDQVHGQQYVDFDEYIDIQLRKTGSTIKTTDVMTAVVGTLTLVTLYLLIFVVFDHWIVPGGFGTLTRGLMLAVVASSAGAWIVWKVVVPWRRRVSGLYAASTIEKASPALKSSLLNLVDISRSGHEVSPEIYQSIERRAALALSHVDVNETVDRRSLLRLSNALLTVVVIFCLYWVFSPKNPATSLWRALVPSADVGVATRTEIFNVHPGDKDVLARSQLEVTADVRGEIPPQTFLFFTTADRKFVDERVEMRLENEATRKFRCVLTGDNGGGILQNLTYRIVAGDATTPEYSIRVVQPPSATIDSIRLDSPEYTRREPVTQTTGAIDALEGTRVTLKAHANMPLRAASLQFFDDETASRRAEEIPIRVIDGTKLEVDWKLEIRSDGTYPRYYRIFCTSTASEYDPSPSLYSLAIRPDQPPEIILRDPKTDLELPANAVLPLLIEAHDPDFALTYIDLNIEKDGSPVNGPTISERTVQQLKTTYKWSLRDYQFRPKDTVTYWLQAKDNRQPIANVSRTPKLRIRIIDPVPEKQVQKDLAEAEKRQKEAADKSDGDQPKQDQADNEKTANNREKKPQPPRRPKDKKQDGAREKQKEEDQQAEGNDKSDDQNNGGQKGDGQQPDKPAGAKESGGQQEKNSADKDDNSNQPTNPDNPADDPKTFQKLLDQDRRERENQNKSPGAGEGDKGAADKKQSDQNKPDKNSPSQDKKDQKQSGSSSDSPQTGNVGPKKQGGGDSKDNPSSGSKPNEAKDQSEAQKDPKGQSPTHGNEKSDSNGTKPQGDKPSEASKKDSKSGAGQDSKGEQQKGGDNGSQQGPKNGSSDSSSDDKNQPDKKDARGDEKSKADQEAGNPNQGKPGDKNSEDHKGQKPDPSENKPAKSGNQDGRPDPKQPPGNQGNASDAGNDSQGPKKGNDGQSQTGNEGGDPKANVAKGKNDPSQSQSPTNDGKPTNPKDGDQPGQNDASHNQSSTKQPGTKEPGTKQPGTKDSDAKENATKEPGSKDSGKQPSKEQGNNRGEKSDANQQRKGDQKGDASQKTERGPKQSSDEKNNGNQSNDRENKQRSEKSDVAPNDDTARPNSKSDERRRDKQDDASSPRKNRTPEEDPLNSVRDKKHAGGAGSEIDPSRGADRKEGTTEQQARPQDAEQKASGQQQQQGGPEGKPGTKEQPGSKQESSDSKSGDGKPGDSEGGKQEQDQKKKGQEGQGQSGQGQKGRQGQEKKGQEGQNGAGKKGQDGQSNPGQKGTKPGAGTGQSSKGNNGGGFNNGDGPGEGAPLVDTTNQANLDYAKKATDLVLQRLEDQLKRGKIDKKIEEELGWNKEQIRRFVERMRKQAQAAQDPNSPSSEARRLQFEETLKSLNLHSSTKRRSNDAVPKTNDSEIGSNPSIPPAEYRDLYEAYTKSLAKPVAPQSDDNK